MFTIIASVLFTSALVMQQGTGSIAGCVVDARREPLPGAAVVATGSSLHHTTETNQAGCYNLKGVAPGTYRVTVQLGGFTNVTRDNVLVASGPATPLDFKMSISGICECVEIGGTLANHVTQADAVLHLRITGPVAGQPEGGMYYEHTAAVLHVIKFPGVAAPAISLLQYQASGAPIPFAVDQEMVVFLLGSSSRLTIVNDTLQKPAGLQKPAMVFLVRDGRIVDAPTAFSAYAGTAVDSFLAQLRTLAPPRRAGLRR